MRRILLLILVFLSSCSNYKKDGHEQTSEKQPREFFDNGFIKSEVLLENDTIREKYFYNYYDSGSIDSLYKFRQFGDTLLPFQQYIYNPDIVSKEIRIENIESDTGNLSKFTLQKPRGEWIAIYLQSVNDKKDSLIQGETKPSNSIVIKNSRDSVILGFVIDRGIYLKTDTAGSIGHFFERYLKFRIKNKDNATGPQQRL